MRCHTNSSHLRISGMDGRSPFEVNERSFWAYRKHTRLQFVSILRWILRLGLNVLLKWMYWTFWNKRGCFLVGDWFTTETPRHLIGELPKTVTAKPHHPLCEVVWHTGWWGAERGTHWSWKGWLDLFPHLVLSLCQRWWKEAHWPVSPSRQWWSCR